MITKYENTPENFASAKSVIGGVVSINAATGGIEVLTGEDVPQVPVPQTVSRMQALIALESAGLLVSLEEHMTSASKIEQIAWNNAQEFNRESPMLTSLAGVLGLDDAALDVLFIAAGGIVV